MRGKIECLTYQKAIDFIFPLHYSGRKPVISQAYGWIIEDNLVAACTFGKPASNSLCKGIAGEDNSPYVYELNRLCRIDSLKEQLSQFVSAVLRRLSLRNWIIVSYSDMGMNHNGYIYQACNFIYTGITKERTDKYTIGNKHSRHYDNAEQGTLRKVRTPKHRYVYFCTRDKKLKKKWISDLNYNTCSFPKKENKNYILGEYQKPIIIDTAKEIDKEMSND